MAGLCNDHLLGTTWWMGDRALHDILLQRVHSLAKWPERPQLKHLWSEAAPAVGGAGRRIIDGGGGRALGAARWC
jgi:hypothetical protein